MPEWTTSQRRSRMEPTSHDSDQIVSDFDAIADALASLPARDRPTPPERALLRHVPSRASTALDAGCGDGVVARELARRGLRVEAVDLSPRMIALARAKTPVELDVRYTVGNVLTAGYPLAAFDVVVSVNMVHHLDLQTAVATLAALVAPDGVLLIQDVVTRRGLRYLAVDIAGWALRRFRRLAGPMSQPRVLDELYERHGAGERYLTPRDAETVYRRLLPGARVEHHVEWRYSVIWSRPAAA